MLAGLIGRLTDPDEGTVLIDGVPVRDLALDEVRRLVSYAFERPVLLGATVYDAIAFGRAPDGANPAGVRTTAGHSARDAGSGAAEGAESGFSRAEVVRAARAARADGFIRLLPAGYDTALDAAPCPAANGSGSASPAPWSSPPGSSSWMTRRPASTP